MSVVGAIDAVPAQDWNAAAGATNPFVRHELLKALETENCLGKRTGWFPRHLLVHRGERLVGATPAYIKTNSYGEFVFDWAFADAYQRAGLDYYPKLVAAVPFTPAPGPRLLVVPDEDVATVREHLMLGAIAFAKQEDLSSVHWLFPEQAHHEALSKQGLLTRMGYQFHWRNHGYRDFQDFLDCLTHKRRKEIRRERRDVEKAALDIEIMWGRDTEECHWAAFHQFYCAIYDRKWGFPSLTLDFFLRLAETLPDSTLLIMARNGGRYIAGTYSVCGTDTLFGRNWGCIENHRGLHFELCYYRHIEIAIEHGLGRLEAGAQGEHKLSRGFMPVPTHSAHWFAHAGFRDAIARLLVEEAGDVQSYLNAAAEHSPFKSESHPPADRSGTGQ
ncbi:MAG: GNAT family N-acetyltransferase [Gammaproteobacteria bacterium]|nr:GNAT family N-acetyltransferase [Gammaproteobacteria bacterium]